MSKYIMRLDDACERMDVCKWERIEKLLDKYGIHPLVGVIPHCEDSMMDKYEFNSNFWSKVDFWVKKGWTIALHGYNHVYTTECGGLNPVNKRSEFAGVSLEIQKEKIRKGVEIFRRHGINPLVFFAPSHTFDENTLIALKEESCIRTISDSIAWDNYSENGFSFVPQQSGTVRKLPFAITTFCYHPNMMSEQHFVCLENFIERFSIKFIDFPSEIVPRKKNFIDVLLNCLYMRMRK